MCGGEAANTALDHPMVLPRCQGYLVPLSFTLCDLTLYIQIQVMVPDSAKRDYAPGFFSCSAVHIQSKKNIMVLEDENPGQHSWKSTSSSINKMKISSAIFVCLNKLSTHLQRTLEGLKDFANTIHVVNRNSSIGNHCKFQTFSMKTALN